MQVNMLVAASAVKSRLLTSGDRKGETVHSLTLYCNGEDGIQTAFVVSCATEAEAKALGAQYGNGSKVRISYVPRENVYVDASNLQLVK